MTAMGFMGIKYCRKYTYTSINGIRCRSACEALPPGPGARSFRLQDCRMFCPPFVRPEFLLCEKTPVILKLVVYALKTK
jgi:hypothetical protein